tara:strand:+ start:75 stop:524 length:450 start_codon:yes stop_codon:yes gene_type:complete
MINDKLKLRGDVAIVLKDKDGNVKDSREIHNLVVSTGLTFICSRMAGTSAGVMSHMALGSGTTAASAGQTDLVSILGSREALDSTSASSNTITYVSSFEAGEGTGAVTEAGVFNASSSGTMLCRTVFPAVNKQADDTMSVTWTITLSAS